MEYIDNACTYTQYVYAPIYAQCREKHINKATFKS